MADIRFWLGMLHRAALKRNDKLLIGNIDTTEPNYIDISELLSVLTTDDLPEGVGKYVTAEEKAKLAAIAEGVLTLAAAAEHFYPKAGNPSGFLTAASNLDADKLTGLLAAALIPDLDAAKITTGSFPAGRIPDLDASKITSGQFDAARIPTLPADKIEGLALELGKYILASSLGKAFGPLKLDENAMVPGGNIPNLDASKISSGTFSEDRLPNVFLKAAQIVDNWSSQAVNLPVSANAVRLLKEYIDGMLSGLKVKQAAFVATTENVVLSGEQIIDGIQTNLSRILVRAQANPVENGIYITGAEAWTRAEDANTGETISGSTVPVINGDILGGLKFICNEVGEIGVDPVTWTEVIEFLLNEAQYLKVENLPEGQVETVDGAQAKSDAALQAANTHTNDGLALKVDKIDGKGLSSEDYTLAEKNKLAAIDAAHYGPPLQSLVELAALPQAQASDKERRYVEDELSDYFYDAHLAVAGENTVAPDDQVGGVGFWRKVSVGGDTAASVKTKYESNPDTNAFTDVFRDKLNSITEIFTTSLKTAYDAASNWVTTNGQNVLDHLTKWATPATAGKMPRTLADGSIEWIDEPSGGGGDLPAVYGSNAEGTEARLTGSLNFDDAPQASRLIKLGMEGKIMWQDNNHYIDYIGSGHIEIKSYSKITLRAPTVAVTGGLSMGHITPSQAHIQGAGSDFVLSALGGHGGWTGYTAKLARFGFYGAGGRAAINMRIIADANSQDIVMGSDKRVHIGIAPSEPFTFRRLRGVPYDGDTVSFVESDEIARFDSNNNFKMEGLDLSNLGEYPDDAAAAAGGIAIGCGYINSATGALHKRRT